MIRMTKKESIRLLEEPTSIQRIKRFQTQLQQKGGESFYLITQVVEQKVNRR